MVYIGRFSKSQFILPSLVIFSGAAIAISIFGFGSSASQSFASNSAQWVEETGAGISAPACSSANASVGCNSADFTLTGVFNFAISQVAGGVLVYGCADGQCPPAVTVSLQPNTAYIWQAGGHNNIEQEEVFTTTDCGSYLTPELGYTYQSPYSYEYQYQSPYTYPYEYPSPYGYQYQYQYQYQTPVGPYSYQYQYQYQYQYPTPYPTPVGPYPYQYQYPSPTFNTPPTISVSPGVILSGGNATLTWSAPGATTCTASASPATGQWQGAIPTSGLKKVTPPVSTTYTITCDTGTNSIPLSVGIIEETAP